MFTKLNHPVKLFQIISVIISERLFDKKNSFRNLINGIQFRHGKNNTTIFGQKNQSTRKVNISKLRNIKINTIYTNPINNKKLKTKIQDIIIVRKFK